MNKTIIGPDINHGKEPIDLPDLPLDCYETGSATITAACTGPDEGLTGVKRSKLHLSAGPDIDFIDTNQEPDLEIRRSSSKQKYQKFKSDQNANKPFSRSQRKLSSKCMETIKLDADTNNATVVSTIDSPVPKIEKATINVVVSMISTVPIKSTSLEPYSSSKLKTNTTTTKYTCSSAASQQRQRTDNLNKNTTAPRDVGGTTIIAKNKENLSPNDNNLKEDPSGSCSTTPSDKDLTMDNVMELPDSIAGVSNWKLENDHAYGLSISLYEKNCCTNEQAGSPIADCYGIVVRGNSAAMALADGVNWGIISLKYNFYTEKKNDDNFFI